MKIAGKSTECAKATVLNIDIFGSPKWCHAGPHDSMWWEESAILRSHQVDAGRSVIMKEEWGEITKSVNVRVISGEIEA